MAKTKSAAAVTDAQIRKAHAEFSQSKQDVDDTRMEHANLCKGLENRGIHRPALKQVHKLLNMDVAKAQDWMRSFDRYSEVLGLSDKLSGQPDMLDEDEGDADEQPTPAAAPDYAPEAVH